MTVTVILNKGLNGEKKKMWKKKIREWIFIRGGIFFLFGIE
jgi:hypothetical protein